MHNNFSHKYEIIRKQQPYYFPPNGSKFTINAQIILFSVDMWIYHKHMNVRCPFFKNKKLDHVLIMKAGTLTVKV